MKALQFAATALMAFPLAAAEPFPEPLMSAIGKLAQKGSYSWTARSRTENARLQESPRTGRLNKDGYAHLKFSIRDTEFEAIYKDGRGALKTEGNWVSFDELVEAAEAGQRDRRESLVRRLQAFEPPAAEARDFAARARGLQQREDGSWSGELTADALKQILTRRARGGPAPDISDARGSVRFWIKDGVLAKYESHMKARMKLNDRDTDLDRTSTVELSDVGTTKFDVPEEAKKKLAPLKPAQESR